MWKGISETLPVKSSHMSSFRTVFTATLCASPTSIALPFLHHLTVLHAQYVVEQWHYSRNTGYLLGNPPPPHPKKKKDKKLRDKVISKSHECLGWTEETNLTSITDLNWLYSSKELMSQRLHFFSKCLKSTSIETEVQHLMWKQSLK